MTKQIKEITFTLPELFEEWTYDESNDQYFIESATHGTLTYLPESNELIVFEGNKKEYVTTIDAFLSSFTGPKVDIKEAAVKMNEKEISNYEQYKNIYMNFSLDDSGVWGLPEGDKTQHFLNLDRLKDYRSFLLNAIDYYTGLSNFYKNEYDYSKKLKKYKLYLKRLDNTLNKLLA